MRLPAACRPMAPKLPAKEVKSPASKAVVKPPGQLKPKPRKKWQELDSLVKDFLY